MKIPRSVVFAVTTTLLFCLSLSAAMAKDEPKNLVNAERVIKEFTAAKKERIPPELLKNANGIVVIPGASKNNFMVSGGSAGGVLLVHETDGKWSNPVFITLSGGTLGWQMVGEPMDIILVLKNTERIDDIIKGKFTMDTRVAVVPGPLGRSMKAATKEERNAEINSYIRSHGKFADVSVAATTVQIDAASNDLFYGKQKINVGDVLSGKVGKSSDDVKKLQTFLADYAASK